MKKLSIFTLTIALIYLLIPEIAYAYLDPGSISYAFQIIAGGIIGLLIGLKFFGHTIKNFFKRIFSRKDIENINENVNKK